MRYIFLLLGIVLLSSCSTYYCSTINSKDSHIDKNEYGEFIVRGDSLDVIYNFFGQNAPITVAVVNKMSRPFYIDWSRSGLIIDDVPTTYIEHQETTQSDSSQLVDFGYFLDNSETLSYVKPYSQLNKQILELANFNFQRIDDSCYENWYTEADSWGGNKKYPTIRYLEDDSPIYLVTFLTIYEDSRSIDNALYYENTFYMSELIKVSSLKSIAAFRDRRGDFFYVKHEKEKKPKKPQKNSPNILKKVVGVGQRIENWVINGSKK